ncbi:MAG: hypothetical protein AAGG65_09930 [Pseudomonadota bacterium]
MEQLATKLVTFFWGSFRKPKRLFLLVAATVFTVYCIVISLVFITNIGAYVRFGPFYEAELHKYEAERADQVSQTGWDAYVEESDNLRTSYVERAVEELGLSLAEAHESYDSVIRYLRESAEQRNELLYPADFDQYADSRIRVLNFQLLLAGSAYLFPMFFALIVSVSCTLIAIIAGLRIARITKVSRFVIFGFALLFDLTLAVLFSGITIVMAILIISGIVGIFQEHYPQVYLAANLGVDERLVSQAAEGFIVVEPGFPREAMGIFNELLSARLQQHEFEFERIFHQTLMIESPFRTYSYIDRIIIRNISGFFSDITGIIGSGNINIGLDRTFRNWILTLSLLPLLAHLLSFLVFLSVATFLRWTRRPVTAMIAAVERTSASPTRILVEVTIVLIALVLALSRL